MTQKTAHYAAMAEETASTVTRNQESWTSFLTTAAKFYKYPYNEQLMIHRQRPDATACAEYAFWNNRWGRFIKRGSKGIALVDYEGNKVNLRYVFDVTDTEERVNSRPVKLWSMQDEYHEAVQAALTKVYAVSAGNGLTTQLEEIARQLASEYWKEHDIRDIVDGSLLEEYDEDNLEVRFKQAVAVSVSYMLMSRCGMKPEQYFEPADFVPIFEFNTKATRDAMGIAISKISQNVLRQIEVAIKNYEREHHVERNVDYERDHLQTGRGRSSPEHRIDRRGEEASRQVWNDAENVFGETPSDSFRLLDAEWNPTQALAGNRRASELLVGRDDAQVGTSSRSDRGTESQRSDEVGRTDEQLQGTGRGDYSSGTDLQLSFLTSDGEAEAENVADTSSAFSFAQSNIEAVTLRENLAARGIVDGRLVDSEKLDNDPFIQQVMADAENAVQENTLNPDEQNLISPDDVEHTPDQELYQVGDTVYLEDTAYTITEVRESSVELLPPNQVYPIYRAESKENFARLLEQDTRNAKYLSRTEHAHESIQVQGEQPSTIVVTNFHITNEHLGEGGAKAKFEANLKAIQLLKKLEATSQQATPEQQQVLSRYVGWGGLADAFDESKANWANEFKTLSATLSPEEYAAARASTLNAHYTSPIVINAMYEAVSNMGFESGNILEPACGVGNFFGMLPEKMEHSHLYGVELDSISGRIAKQLYPKADITVAGFETTNRQDFFDFAIGNIPFGNYKVSDKPYDKLGFSIHNYFFAKTIDQVRPGGVIAFVTSRFTMDSKNSDARKYIAQRAELLGAIRLPNDAFKKNAGTEVVSDIIFLQKRDQVIDIVPDWVHLSTTDDGYTMNSYFVDHSEMILGELTTESTQYGKDDLTVRPRENVELAEQLKEAITHIRGSYQEIDLTEKLEETHRERKIEVSPEVRNYSYTMIDGEVYYRENNEMILQEVNPTVKERIKGMIALRDCTRKLIAYQIEDYAEQSIQEVQQQLNQLYDSFVSQYGRIGSHANNSAFRIDNSYYLLTSLEVTDSEGNFVRKADMFTKRTIKQKQIVTSVDTASEALVLSLSEKARVDIPYMTDLTGKNEETLVSELRGVIFRLPSSMNTEAVYVTADEYLSGNVREKLREAKQAAATDQAYGENVSALEAIQPVDLTPGEISVRLGATWIPPEDVRAFMFELFNTPGYARWDIKVHYSKVTGAWNIEGKSHDRSSIKARSTYGTNRINGYKIIEDTLNLKDVRIFDYVEDENGRRVAVLNRKETAIAQAKQELIKQAFSDWIWKDPERRERLCIQYNEQYNSVRSRQYDGSHLNFVGINPEIKLRQHQVNAIAHIIYGGNTLLAHVVGAGKTFEIVAAAQESKRLGLCHKSMIAVPNHLTEQWASEYLQLYPSANILVVTKKDFEPKNRKKFCARIAASDIDAVIIGHSQLEKIPMSVERQKSLLEEQIQEVVNGIADLKANDGERFSIKQMEKTKKSLEAKLKKLNDQSRKDDVVTFEELGVDRLFVDEAHSFKNLAAYSKMRNVAGISQTEAQKSSDLYMKCRYLDELTGGRGVIFATGTPISNSMVEMYTMQKYLQHDILKEKELLHFDAWASTFGETVNAMELAPEGTGYRSKTRFARFYNLPELMTMFREAADIQTADMLNLPVPKANYHNIVLKPSEHQQEMVKTFADRAERVRNKMVDSSVDNMLLITNDGRKLALDQRLLNPILPDSETGKVSACAENVFDIWQRTAEQRSTQMVFCDLSTPKNDGNFNVYDDLRDKLIAHGIPAKDIAYIHDANTEAKKKELFGKVNSGEVRILIGSTQKMGAGTNCQKQLIALHHLDCPWRPADLQQREGRIIRQGNENDEVDIYTYLTENTFDSYLYQLVESKQKFIGQIMTSKSPVRSAEDIDEAALSYAEIKALCTGNPHIKEKMDLDVEVQRLKLLKSNYLTQKYGLEDQIAKVYPQNIAALEQRCNGYQSDIAVANGYKNIDFSIEIDGRIYNEKKEAGVAILNMCKTLKSHEPIPLGVYHGFSLTLSFDAMNHEFVIVMQNSLRHPVRLGDDPYGTIQRMDNVLNSLPARLEGCKDQLTETRKQLAIAQEEVQKPFAQEEELTTKSARLAELDALLNMEETRGQKKTERIKEGDEVMR